MAVTALIDPLNHPIFPMAANQKVQCLIRNELGHSARNCNGQGNFAYVEGTVVDTNSCNETDIDYSWCLNSDPGHPTDHMTPTDKAMNNV